MSTGGRLDALRATGRYSLPRSTLLCIEAALFSPNGSLTAADDGNTGGTEEMNKRRRSAYAPSKRRHDRAAVVYAAMVHAIAAAKGREGPNCGGIRTPRATHKATCHS